MLFRLSCAQVCFSFCASVKVLRRLSVSVSNVGGCEWSFFRIFENKLLYFVVTICDIVHDVTTVFHLRLLLIASCNLF